MTFHERHGDADGRILPCALCLELQIESWKKEEAAWIEERKRLQEALRSVGALAYAAAMSGEQGAWVWRECFAAGVDLNDNQQE